MKFFSQLFFLLFYINDYIKIFHFISINMIRDQTKSNLKKNDANFQYQNIKIKYLNFIF